MADIRESSGLFSLNGLFEREHRRITEEFEADQRRLETVQRERVEREREAWELAERLRREQEERVRREARHRREDQARIDAIRQGEIERMHLESGARATLEVAARKQEHDLKLAGIREQGRRRRAEQLLVVTASLLFATIVAALSFYFVKLRPEAERMHALYEQLVSAERNSAEQTALLLERSEKRRGDLARQLENTERELDTLQSAAGAAPGKPGVKPARALRVDPRVPVDKPRIQCRDDGDPLNGCLKR